MTSLWLCSLSLSLLSPVSFCLSFFVLCLLPAQTTENDNIPLRLNMLNPWSWAHASSHQEPCLRPCRPCRPHSQTLARPENTRNGGHGVPRCWRRNGFRLVSNKSARFTAFCPVACAHLFLHTHSTVSWILKFPCWLKVSHARLTVCLIVLVLRRGIYILILSAGNHVEPVEILMLGALLKWFSAPPLWPAL